MEKCYKVTDLCQLQGESNMNGHMRQKEQSRQMIENAFFELLEEKEYSQITVSEIVQRADVARRTFYRLYENKEGIIQHYFSRLCNEYQNSYQALERYDLKQIAKDFFSFWYQQRANLLKLHNAGVDYVLYHGISNASTEVIRRRVADEGLRQSPEMQYFADYSVGGFINLLFRWINSGMEGTPEQYAKTVSGAILKTTGQR